MLVIGVVGRRQSDPSPGKNSKADLTTFCRLSMPIVAKVPPWRDALSLILNWEGSSGSNAFSIYHPFWKSRRPLDSVDG